jgi:hypothetical protein
LTNKRLPTLNKLHPFTEDDRALATLYAERPNIGTASRLIFESSNYQSLHQHFVGAKNRSDELLTVRLRCGTIHHCSIPIMKNRTAYSNISAENAPAPEIVVCVVRPATSPSSRYYQIRWNSK